MRSAGIAAAKADRQVASNQNPELLAKLTLCMLGLYLLFSVSHGILAPVALMTTTILTYGLGACLRCTTMGAAHRLLARTAVPLAFLALMAMNVFGWIGTLTGTTAPLAQGFSTAWIAIPFYLLSAAAFVSEMAVQRMPLPRWLDFAVYMALPFKLLAGPLEPPRLLAQIAAYKISWRRSRLLVAWSWFVLGAFMKYVIANRLDPAQNLIYTDPVRSLATAAVFELKFYFDFAGYSFMAYGAALAIGLRINQNFNHPFLAKNVVLFWRSWHMSLGRFLGRYILEPNLHAWRGRNQKMVFASLIFLVSAMWHGGTLNYVLWGLFHAVCYFGYGYWFKKRNVWAWAGLTAMVLFFVLGRMLAIDSDQARLISRLGQFISLEGWPNSIQQWHADKTIFASGELKALLLAAVFIGLEAWGNRFYKRAQGYHVLRRPLSLVGLWLFFLLFGLGNGALLYARI